MNAPAARETPATVQELADLVARCDAGGQKIAIAGGDTLRGMGYPPARAGVTLLTTGLASVIDYEQADLTIAAQAGIPIRTLATLLAQHGQFVPFDAPRPQYATLGGTLAAGWLGPRRHLYGRVRDYVLGSEIVLADGTVARAGGMVVKNVAGYDMSRLYVGSFGTLGVLVRANLKTLPSPRSRRAFLARLPEGTRTRACAAAAGLRIRPSAALWVEGFRNAVDGDDGLEGRLFVLLESSETLIERATRDLRSALGRAGVPETSVIEGGAREAFERAVDAYVACIGERSISYRIFCQAGDVEPRAARVRELAHRFELRHESIVDVMNGDAVVRVSDLDARALGAKIESFDDALHEIEPHAQVIAGDHAHRGELQVWGAPPATLDRMRELKARFDPNATLNPGRFVGRI